MQIRPSSALRNEYTQISELAKASGEPIFITNKGEDDGVFMSMAAYEEREKLPHIDDLDLLEDGAVFVNESNKHAFLNDTEGSYLIDKKTGKLYGQYKGAIYSTPYKECRRANCVGCDIDCPLMK